MSAYDCQRTRSTLLRRTSVNSLGASMTTRYWIASDEAVCCFGVAGSDPPTSALVAFWQQRTLANASISDSSRRIRRDGFLAVAATVARLIRRYGGKSALGRCT